ncbi:MAG: response regulator [Candidatus Helarchaeota archaeon]
MTKKNSIIVVDDDIGMGESIKDILSELSYCVTVVRNGYEAIKRIKNAKYGTVLMDIIMPGIDGVETYKRIKKLNLKSQLKVIMMTAYSVENLIKDALAKGAKYVLSKPLNIKKVIKYIKTI